MLGQLASWVCSVQVQQQVGHGADPFALRGFDAQPLRLEHGEVSSMHDLTVQRSPCLQLGNIDL